MASYDVTRSYADIEPIPKPPPRRPVKQVFIAWLALAIINLAFSRATNEWVNYDWLFWIAFYPLPVVIGSTRDYRQFRRDLEAWTKRANAYHEQKMAEIERYANREWN